MLLQLADSGLAVACTRWTIARSSAGVQGLAFSAVAVQFIGVLLGPLIALTVTMKQCTSTKA